MEISSGENVVALDIIFSLYNVCEQNHYIIERKV